MVWQRCGEIERFIEKCGAGGQAGGRAALQIASSFLRLDFLISSKNGSTDTPICWFWVWAFSVGGQITVVNNRPQMIAFFHIITSAVNGFCVINIQKPLTSSSNFSWCMPRKRGPKNSLRYMDFSLIFYNTTFDST